jgi:hypothetical protein
VSNDRLHARLWCQRFPGLGYGRGMTRPLTDFGKGQTGQLGVDLQSGILCRSCRPSDPVYRHDELDRWFRGGPEWLRSGNAVGVSIKPHACSSLLLLGTTAATNIVQ